MQVTQQACGKMKTRKGLPHTTQCRHKSFILTFPLLAAGIHENKPLLTKQGTHVFMTRSLPWEQKR